MLQHLVLLKRPAGPKVSSSAVQPPQLGQLQVTRRHASQRVMTLKGDDVMTLKGCKHKHSDGDEGPPSVCIYMEKK